MNRNRAPQEYKKLFNHLIVPTEGLAGLRVLLQDSKIFLPTLSSNSVGHEDQTQGRVAISKIL